MEQTIQIRFIEQKTTKAGRPMWKIVDQSNKPYSCFDSAIAQKLQPGKAYNLDIETSGTFTNIMGYVSEGASTELVKATPAKTGMNVAAMLTSYAKDLFIKMMDTKPYEGIALEDGMLQASKAVLAAYEEISKKV